MSLVPPLRVGRGTLPSEGDAGDGIVADLDFHRDRLRRLGGEARDEHAAAARQHRAGDADDLSGRLAAAEDDFGDALPQGAVVVHLRVAQILKRAHLQVQHRLLGRDRPRFDLLQNL